MTINRFLKGDFLTDVAKGIIPNHSAVSKFGHNEDVDTGTVPETLWDGGGIYLPPTEPRIHNIKSSSIEDAGSVVSSGTATSTSNSLIDGTATFISDGVAVLDAVLDDTGGDHSYVTAVVSETELTLAPMHHNGVITIGNSYRVVNATGTGASVVHIKRGIDSNKNFKTEFIVMNGTTDVATPAEYWRINRSHVDGLADQPYGSKNVGDITFTAATDATVTALIKAGHGQTLTVFDTVPTGYYGLIYSWYAGITRDSTKAAAGSVELIQVPYCFDQPFGSRIFDELPINSASLSTRKYSIPRKIEQETDVYINVTNVSDNNLRISGGFDLVLVKM